MANNETKNNAFCLKADLDGLNGIHQAILDCLPISVLCVDANGKIRMANKATCEDININGADLTGQSVGKALECAAEKANGYCGSSKVCRKCQIRRAIEDTFASGKGVYKKAAHLTVHENEEAVLHHFLLSTSLVGVKGERQVVVALDDVSAQVQLELYRQKEAESNLENEREFLATALDAQLDTFFLFEPSTGKALQWNKAFREASGYSEEEIATLPAPASYYSPEDMLRATDFVQKVLAEGAGTIELELICKDGHKVPTEYRVSVIRDEAGEPAFIISIGRDITERRRVEEAMSHQQRCIELNNEIASVFLTSQQENTYSKVLEVIVGALKCDFGYLGHFDDNDDLICITYHTSKRGQGSNGSEHVILRPDRLEAYFESSLTDKRTLILDSETELSEFSVRLSTLISVPLVHHDRIIGQIVVGGDKTKIDALELELMESSAAQIAPVLDARLTSLIQAKEHALLEEQYLQSQKMEAVGRLAGGVAHDFNNLLLAIVNNAELAADDVNADSPLYSDLHEIIEAGEKASLLTRQLLAFSRKQILEPKVIDLNDLVKNLAKLLQRLIGEDIKLFVKLAANLGPISADPGQIEQVIMNLAVNARDAMPLGGELTIETANVQLTSEQAADIDENVQLPFVALIIKDNGQGMDEELKELIFEPFFTTKEKGQGTGLGLSTVYGIVRQSGGGISVESEKGIGTTFTIFLPRVEGKKSTPAKKTETSRVEGNETVLVVEDEKVVRRLAARIISSRGYLVLEASSGAEALELCNEYSEKIDLVLTDVVMPGMSGREFADELLKSRPEVKVLYMSGYTDDAIVKHGVLAPGTNFIAKPFRGVELVKKLRSVLDD